MAAYASVSKTPATKQGQSSGDSHSAVSQHVRKLVNEVLAWQRRIHNRGQIPNKYSTDAEERNLGMRFAKLLYRRFKAVGKEASRSKLSPSEVALVNSVPCAQFVAAITSTPNLRLAGNRRDLRRAANRRDLRPHGCSATASCSNSSVDEHFPEPSSVGVHHTAPLNRGDQLATGSRAKADAKASKVKMFGSCSGSGGLHSTARAKADAKRMRLYVKRCYYDAIKTGRKRWDCRSLLERRRDGCFYLWSYIHLATKGREIIFQSGRPPFLRMQVAEVRFFASAKAMVEELGDELLPDDADANARFKSLSEIYGAEVCNSGFVAMRLKPLDGPEMVAASSYSRVLNRSSASKAAQGLKRPAAARESTSKQRPTQRRRLSNDGYI